jgi:hypothetical protein
MMQGTPKNIPSQFTSHNDPRISDVEKDTRMMGIVRWRHVAQDRDGERRGAHSSWTVKPQK